MTGLLAPDDVRLEPEPVLEEVHRPQRLLAEHDHAVTEPGSAAGLHVAAEPNDDSVHAQADERGRVDQRLEHCGQVGEPGG